VRPRNTVVDEGVEANGGVLDPMRRGGETSVAKGILPAVPAATPLSALSVWTCNWIEETGEVTCPPSGTSVRLACVLLRIAGSAGVAALRSAGAAISAEFDAERAAASNSAAPKGETELM